MKLRVVFDCSLCFKEESLNKNLLQGPDLTSNLFSVLLKFRQNYVAFMADIKQMFYQVQVPKQDRNFLRFLWYKDGDLNQEPTQFRLKVHVFGAASSPSCSNYALRRIAQEENNASLMAKETILNNFYVDDVLKSVSDEATAIKLIQEIIVLLAEHGFNLTSFVSNSRCVLDALP